MKLGTHVSGLEVEDKGYGACVARGMTQVDTSVGTGLPLRGTDSSLIRLSENEYWATPCMEVGGEEVADDAGKFLEWAAPFLVEG